VTIDVVGIPVPKGSKTAYRSGSRIVMVEGKSPEARQRVSSWRLAIAQAAARECSALDALAFPEGPVRVSCAFRMPRPKTAPKRVVCPTTKPDVDKLSRLALDELTGIVWKDDSQVCELLAVKAYATGIPGVTITINAIEAPQAAKAAIRKRKAA
jgi:Holliday junction resolvase RusA-like endonuclease